MVYYFSISTISSCFTVSKQNESHGRPDGSLMTHLQSIVEIILAILVSSYFNLYDRGLILLSTTKHE
jgi:hypothetical protein